jgi:hypothetical protein
MRLLLRSHDTWGEYAEWDTKRGELRAISAPTDVQEQGLYSTRGTPDPILFYADRQGHLRLDVGEVGVRLVDIEDASLLRQRDGRCELILVARGGSTLRVLYELPPELVNIADGSPFVEDDDFDLFLYMLRVWRDADWQERLSRMWSHPPST